jgi:hypothetical protein
MVTPEELQAALQSQSMYSEKLGTTLVETGIVTLEQLKEALSIQYGVPAAQDAHFQRADPQLRTRLRAGQAARLKAIPLFATSARRVAVAMVDPGNSEVLQELSFILNAAVEPLVTPDIVLNQMLERLYAVPKRRATSVRPPIMAKRRSSPGLRIDTTSLADDVGDCAISTPTEDLDGPPTARRRSALTAPVDDLPPLTPVPPSAPLTPVPPAEVEGRFRARRTVLAAPIEDLPPLTPSPSTQPLGNTPPPFAMPPMAPRTPPAPAGLRMPHTPPPLNVPRTPPAPAGLRMPHTPPPLNVPRTPPAPAGLRMPPTPPPQFTPLTPGLPGQSAAGFAPLVPEITPPPTRIPTPLYTPLSSDAVVVQLLSATNRMDAAQILLDFMRSSFRAGAMFTISGVFAIGRFGFGPLGMSPTVESVSFSLSLPSCFRLAHTQHATFRGAPPPDGLAVHQRLWTALGDEVPAQVLVAPVMVNANIALLLYAHGRTIDAHAAGRLENVCVALGSALERVVE